MKEELYKWYPIVDEGEYWTDYEYTKRDEFEKISTIVSAGTTLYTYEDCPFGWGTMAKLGDWKYMRIKIE